MKKKIFETVVIPTTWYISSDGQKYVYEYQAESHEEYLLQNKMIKEVISVRGDLIDSDGVFFPDLTFYYIATQEQLDYFIDLNSVSYDKNGSHYPLIDGKSHSDSKVRKLRVMDWFVVKVDSDGNKEIFTIDFLIVKSYEFIESIQKIQMEQELKELNKDNE